MLALVLLKQGSLSAQTIVVPNILMNRCDDHISLQLTHCNHKELNVKRNVFMPLWFLILLSNVAGDYHWYGFLSLEGGFLREN